ncbi:hypothetical protein [Streptomyces endophytica]|uniref:Uncharacterized protein n=1 Tax=Streptomyces endophytica TaxID=2991496 RepID=A0ABY6PE09_9ACTN|nr:hypothetical protein [Streptomyces endophytica]UZJ32016.1 hypothetical protein OJ254_19200 [Streptomyces endophytica]
MNDRRGPGRSPRPRGTRALFAAVTAVTALTAATACAGGPAAAPGATASRPASASRTLEGVWRMDGYGTLVTIKGRSLRTYETTAVSCLPGAVTGTRAGGPDARGRSRFTVPDSAPLTVARTAPAVPG